MTITRSQAIANSLSEEIVGGRLVPGQRLDEQSLASRFKVSRTPVRDALRDLAATRLIEYRPRRGFTVARGDMALDDVFEAASEIEALCARLCALRARATDRTHIFNLHKDGQISARKNEAKKYSKLNESFHAAIYVGTRNATIERIALDLRRQLAPFRIRLFYTADRVQKSVQEHEEIVSAILAQSGDKAAEAMRNHTARSALNVMQYLQTRTAKRT